MLHNVQTPIKSQLQSLLRQRFHSSALRPTLTLSTAMDDLQQKGTGSQQEQASQRPRNRGGEAQGNLQDPVFVRASQRGAR